MVTTFWLSCYYNLNQGTLLDLHEPPNWPWNGPWEANFGNGPIPPTPLMEKIKTKNNDLHNIKLIFYDMDHLASVRWLCQRAWKFKATIWLRSYLRRLPPSKMEKNKFVLKWFLGNFKGFKLKFELSLIISWLIL